MARVLVPLPDRDFDPTEVAVPWLVLTREGHDVVFATERGGAAPAADPRLLSGVIFGMLGAADDALRAYRGLTSTEAFANPVPWGALEVEAYDGLLLPGGHAQGMRQYLGSEALQAKVAAFWALRRPVGAICHGVLVLARTRTGSGSGSNLGSGSNPGSGSASGKSVLHGRRTTCLPKYMERAAYLSTAWKLGKYYRTYPAYVEDEVRAALRDPARQFERGPRTLIARGTEHDEAPAFVVEDDNYVSARWPGDAWLFARRFAARL